MIQTSQTSLILKAFLNNSFSFELILEVLILIEFVNIFLYVNDPHENLFYFKFHIQSNPFITNSDITNARL